MNQMIQTSAEDTSCEEILDLLPDYLNHRLSAAEVVRVSRHLAQCEDCCAELAMLVKLRSTVRLEGNENEKRCRCASFAFDLVREAEKQQKKKKSYALPITQTVKKLRSAAESTKSALSCTADIVEKSVAIPVQYVALVAQI